jgi:hypothetical protein
VRGHDDLEPRLSADFIADMKHAFGEYDLGRSPNVENAIQIRWHEAPSAPKTTERAFCLLPRVNNLRDRAAPLSLTAQGAGFGQHGLRSNHSNEALE